MSILINIVSIESISILINIAYSAIALANIAIEFASYDVTYIGT